MAVCRPEVPRFAEVLDKSESVSVLEKVDKVSTLDDLIQQLHKAFDSDYVNIDHVQTLMLAYKSNPQDWKKYAKFDRYRFAFIFIYSFKSLSISFSLVLLKMQNLFPFSYLISQPISLFFFLSLL